ncbi:MAG: hypothetical protein IT537_28435 [Hyphomicrobiales bacterium]|nr:hypothetical protein [Hyphomicrobiales bacterium]
MQDVGAAGAEHHHRQIARGVEQSRQQSEKRVALLTLRDREQLLELIDRKQ